MTILKQTGRLISQPLVALTLLSIAYVILIFTLPADSATMETYNLTPLGYRIVYFSLVLPSFITWLASFAGFERLREYATLVRNTQEGKHFAKLATGAKWLAWSLPVSAIYALVSGGLANKYEGLQAFAVITSNYLNIALPLIAFATIGAASRGLVNSAKLQFTPKSSRVIMLLFIMAGIFYCFLVFQWLDLSDPGSRDNPYFLPVWLTILTVSIPYLYAWFVGLLGAYEITLFSKYTKGLLYKKALRLLVSGLVIVILSSIALQYITTALPRFGKLVFDERLLAVMVFRLIRAVGFVVLTVGAIRLKKIEEV